MVEGVDSKIKEKLISIFKAIHGLRIPIEVIIDNLEESSEEWVIHGKYRLITSKKYFPFKAIFDKNIDFKYLERLERARLKWKHPTILP